VFGAIPVDSDNLDWLYPRRHLAKVHDGKWRERQYVVEFDELEHVILETLDRIRKRDGAKIANEVAARLVDSIAVR
jgi:nucleoside-triphosphatase THEP1